MTNIAAPNTAFHMPDPAGSYRLEGPGHYRFLTGFFQRQTWREFLYHFAALLLAPFGFAYAVATISLGASLAVTVVGLVAPAALIAAARYWGTVQRSLAASLLQQHIAEPVPFRRQSGFFAFLRSGLSDSAGWRAIAHQAVSFVVSVAAFCVSISFFAAGLGATTHWFWYRYLPLQQAADGSWHQGAQLGWDYYIDTPPRQLLFAAMGAVLLLFVWPALNHGFARLQAVLAAGLLGPTTASLRLRDVEHSRNRTVEDSDARLRRIERDLHDGTQAQLVAIAMKLGDARDRLSGQETAPEVAALLESAHGTAKDALVDLRDLAKGIHPPALNDGLGAALETLAAQSPVRTSLVLDIADRPAPAVEATAYFCVMELVTNAVKHARAAQIRINVRTAGHRLVLHVDDDGRGGAELSSPTASGHHSGLAGLAERVAAVDGTLHIQSPAGGPTSVGIDLPLDPGK